MSYSWRTLSDGRVEVDGVIIEPPLLERIQMDSNVLGRWELLTRQVAEESRAWVKGGVPEHWILGVMGAESFGNPRAQSGVGAVGLMQVLPRYHFPAGSTEADWYDPLKNIRAGTKYIASLRAKGYDLPQTASAYNVGHIVRTDSSPWGLYADSDKYITRVVERANYAASKIGSSSTATFGKFALVGLAAVGIGWYALRHRKR